MIFLCSGPVSRRSSCVLSVFESVTSRNEWGVPRQVCCFCLSVRVLTPVAFSQNQWCLLGSNWSSSCIFGTVHLVLALKHWPWNLLIVLVPPTLSFCCFWKSFYWALLCVHCTPSRCVVTGKIVLMLPLYTSVEGDENKYQTIECDRREGGRAHREWSSPDEVEHFLETNFAAWARHWLYPGQNAIHCCFLFFLTK